jgi:hypothetical protein
MRIFTQNEPVKRLPADLWRSLHQIPVDVFDLCGSKTPEGGRFAISPTTDRVASTQPASWVPGNWLVQLALFTVFSLDGFHALEHVFVLVIEA